MNFQRVEELAHQLPDFNIGHITAYFIQRITSDGKSANDFKSINKRAFPLYKDGHVQQIHAKMDDKICTYKCVCLPEMKKNTTYCITMTVENDGGNIMSASCGCPAGLGPTGSCKHIASMCYALEEFTRLKATRDHVACTSKLQEWNQPRKRKLECEKSSDIKFVKLEYGKTKRAPNQLCYDPRPSFLQRTSTSEVTWLKDGLQAMKSPCAFLHVLPSSSSSSSCTPSFLPPIPKSSREKVLVQMRSMDHPLSLQQIADLGENLVGRLRLDRESSSALAISTAQQHQSKRWHQDRFGRMTSSRFGEIIKCRIPSNTCMKILYPSKADASSSSLQWGRNNEQRARELYIQQAPADVSVRTSGLHVSDLRHHCCFSGWHYL